MADVTPEEKLLNVIKKAQGKTRLKRDLRVFTKVNLILVFLTASILIIFLVDVFTPEAKISELYVGTPEQENIVPVVKDWSEMYEDADAAAPEKPSISGKDLAKDLLLLGIVEGDEDQAIIEDKGKKKTFFVYEGDEIGGFKVFNIKDGIVTLDRDGEKIELKM